MIVQGLHHLIATKRAAAGAAARAAREQQAKDPRCAHECNVTAERLALEAEQHADHVKGNEEMMEGIMHEINYLARSAHKSRCRSLCLTALEEAHNWLMRENGDREPERDFEILPPEPTINGQAVS
jgi:hypothetical protein